MLSYLTIVLFAILEGEIYYSKVCADAMIGKLNWAIVWCAGALGGSLGDQFWFYLLRKRIHWLDRYPALSKRCDAVSERVHAHEAAERHRARRGVGLADDRPARIARGVHDHALSRGRAQLRARALVRE